MHSPNSLSCDSCPKAFSYYQGIEKAGCFKLVYNGYDRANVWDLVVVAVVVNAFNVRRRTRSSILLGD